MAVPVTPIRPVEVPSLDDLARDPWQAADLPAAVRRKVTLQCVALIGACAAVDSPATPNLAEAPSDEWLSPEEAAALTKKTRTWLVRHHRRLPFARQLTRKTIVFSRRGILRWLETRGR